MLYIAKWWEQIMNIPLKTIYIFGLVIASFACGYVLTDVSPPQAFAAKEFCRSATPYGEGELLEDSTQTVCFDKKAGEYSFTCEGTYANIGEECGQTFEVDKQDAQKGIKHERENCRENEDWTCEKTKTDND
jgi:hypothetical protein